MRSKMMQPASRFIQAGSSTSVLNHANKLSRLQRWLDNQLPDSIHGQCQVINFRDNTLILAASSPVWATRLRFLAPQLSNPFGQKEAGKPLNIKIKVRPLTYPAKVKSHPRLTISDTTGQLLKAIASGINHPELGASLVRIAAHSRKA
jgi:hypothetical protein